MKFEKRQKSCGYLHGVLLDGAKPFLYRSGVRTLLGVKDTDMESGIFPMPSPVAGFGYVNRRGLSSGRNSGKSDPYAWDDIIDEANEETSHDPDADRGDLLIERINSDHPAADPQDETGERNVPVKSVKDDVVLPGSGLKIKEMPAPLKKITRSWEPDSVVFQREESVPADESVTGPDQSPVDLSHRRKASTDIQRHLRADPGAQSNIDISSDVTMNEAVKNAEQGKKEHTGSILRAKPENYSNWKTAGILRNQMQSSGSFSETAVLRSIDRQDETVKPDKLREPVASAHSGNSIFNRLNTGEVDRIERIRQIVRNHVSDKSFEDSGKKNEEREHKAPQKPKKPAKKPMAARGRSYRPGTATVFWERSYLGHFHLRPLR